MDIDLFKYILRLSVIPMLFVSLLLITHGTDDGINIINVIGIVLLIISGAIIINIDYYKGTKNNLYCYNLHVNKCKNMEYGYFCD